jgi:hypothetical protein
MSDLVMLHRVFAVYATRPESFRKASEQVKQGAGAGSDTLQRGLQGLSRQVGVAHR